MQCVDCEWGLACHNLYQREALHLTSVSSVHLFWVNWQRKMRPLLNINGISSCARKTHPLIPGPCIIWTETNKQEKPKNKKKNLGSEIDSVMQEKGLVQWSKQAFRLHFRFALSQNFGFSLCSGSQAPLKIWTKFQTFSLETHTYLQNLTSSFTRVTECRRPALNQIA